MTVRRVFYSAKMDVELREQLRIVSFKKAKKHDRDSKVYFVDFATQADADAAAKKCRRLGNMTLKEYQPRTAMPGVEKNPPPSRAVPVPKVRHVSSQLAPNSPIISTITDALRSCLSVMETARKSMENIRRVNDQSIVQRLYDEHCAAFYMKRATLAQLKTAFKTGIRLTSNQADRILVELEEAVLFEQSFESQTSSMTRMHAKINFRSSIVLTSQLLCQVSSMTRA